MAVIQALCDCGFRGTVSLYDIGDGPEWCCPRCDMCHCPTAVVGPDGLTDAERKMVAEGRRLMEERHGPATTILEIRMK